MATPAWPQFTGRNPVQFISDDRPSLSITKTQNTLYNNPRIYKISAGNVAKLAPAIDGTAKIAGQGEYSPFGLSLQWAELGYNDYQNLAALVPYNLTFISFRNVGFYGRLLLEGPDSSKPFTADAVACSATFLVLNPSDDGGAATVNRLATPTTLSVTGDAGGGYIPNGTTTYYFLTFHTKFGETLAQSTSHTNGSSGPYANTIAWSWPSSTYCTYASLYCGTKSNGSDMVLMAEVLRGSTAGWTDLVGYAGVSPPGVGLYQQAPSSSNAFTGYWAGGIWVNDT